ASQSAQRAFTLTVNPQPLQITTQTVPDTVVGSSYSQTLAASGGVAPFTWTITAGSLPTGLSLSTAGAITGTPSAAGTFVYSVQLADGSSQIATRQFTTVVAPPSLSLDTTSLQEGVVNLDYTSLLSASGGTPPYTWTVVVGTLPANLTLSTSGSITGIPTTIATTNLTIRVQDGASQTAQRAFTLTVNPEPLQITTPSLPDGPAGAPYSFTMARLGGVAPYTWSIAVGPLPPGINFSAAGVFSGTPTTPGQYNIRIRLADSTGAAVTRDMVMNITPVFRVTTPQVWGGIQAQTYNQTLLTADGTNPISWSVSSGTLPTGLSLAPSTGVLSGTPTTTGTFTFTVQATDSFARTATRTYSTIISSSSANYGNVGDPYATEGGFPDPAATVLSACTGTTALAPNKSYRLSQNLNAATPADRCFTLSSGIKLDLAGFTVTGSLKLNGNPSGISIFNGTINCSVVDGVTVPGCVSVLSGSTPTVTARLHHLTITNTGNGTRGIHLDWPLTAKQNFTTIRIYNLTVVVPSQPSVSRSYAISFQGGNQTPEFFSNDLTCTANAAACQGIMCYGTADCKVHHNKVNLDFNTSGADTARGILFDGVGLDGEAWNNLINAHNNRGVRIRGTTNVRVHDNKFLNVETNGSGVVWLADGASTDTNNLNALVDNNDFEMAGGNVIFIRNGINALVRNNRFTCLGLCNSSKLAVLRSPGTPGTTFTELTLENNSGVILFLSPPQTQVDAGAVVNICNSGQAGGTGSVNPTACAP
ncbi:MAG: putative Ig domain-containing protein, partial [Terriglobales bacterium]